MWTCTLPHRLMEMAHTTRWVIVFERVCVCGLPSEQNKPGWGREHYCRPRRSDWPASLCMYGQISLSWECVQLPVFFPFLQDPLTHCDVIHDSTAHIPLPQEGSKEALVKERYEPLPLSLVIRFCSYRLFYFFLPWLCTTRVNGEITTGRNWCCESRGLG